MTLAAVEDEAWERSRFAGSSTSSSPRAIASPNRDQVPLPPASPPTQPAATARANQADDPFAFLASIFSKVPYSTFERKLNAGFAVSAIVEELLTEELLAAEAANPSSQSSASSSTSSSPAPFVKYQPKKPKNGYTVSLTDVLQRPGSSGLNNGHGSSGSRSRDSSPARDAWTQASSSTNQWAAFDSRSAHLAQLCHVKPTRVASLLHTCAGSPAKALTTLLNQLRQERAQAATSSSLLSQLRAILPGVGTDRLQTLLAAADGDLSDALDLERFIAETELDEVGGAPLVKVDMIRDKSANGGSAVYHHQKRYLPGLSDQASPSARAAGAMARARASEHGGAFDERSYSSEDCLNIARDYLEKVSCRSKARETSSISPVRSLTPFRDPAAQRGLPHGRPPVPPRRQEQRAPRSHDDGRHWARARRQDAAVGRAGGARDRARAARARGRHD